MLTAKQLEPSIGLDPSIKYFAFLISENIKNAPANDAELQMHVNICSRENALNLEAPKRKDEFIVECILAAVMDAARIPSVNLLFTHTRKAVVCLPRQLAMYLIRKHTTMGLKKIAKTFRPNKTRFDHSTVIHSCKKIQNLIDTKDEDLADLYNRTVMNFENLSGIHRDEL